MYGSTRLLISQIMILLLVLAIGAVAAVTITNTRETKPRVAGFRMQCLNGVEYWVGGTYLAPALNLDGSLVRCDELTLSLK